jgi:hypothetical protein
MRVCQQAIQPGAERCPASRALNFSEIYLDTVLPSKAKLHVHKDGIQGFQEVLGSGFRRGDRKEQIFKALASPERAAALSLHRSSALLLQVNGVFSDARQKEIMVNVDFERDADKVNRQPLFPEIIGKKC